MTLKRIGIELVVDNADPFFNAIKKAIDAQDKLGASAGDAAKKADSAFGEIVRGAQRQLGAQFVNIAMDAGHALINFFTGSIDQAGKFESTMNRFASVTGQSLSESGKSVKDFSALFIKLGQDTQYSAQQAGDAAVELAKGGIDPATIAAGALADTLNLAAAGELGLADAATIVAKQLGVWKDTGVDSAQVADRLAQAANASTVDVKELALGLANVGGVAKAAGVSFDETVQTLALLAPGFSSASDAGTSFKTFLAQLQPTTKPAIAAMESLGLYTKTTGSLFYDAQGQFIGMDAATKLLHDSTAGLSEAQKSLQLRLIFGQDAQRAAIMLAEQGADGFDKMGESMTKAGSATEQAEKKHQGYAVAVQELQGSLETLQIAIGQRLIPTLTNLAKAATDAVNELTDLANVNQFTDKTEEHILAIASSYEEYSRLGTQANKEIVKLNENQGIMGQVLGTNAKQITGVTRAQYDFIRSLEATGVPLQSAIEQAKGVDGLAQSLESLKKSQDPATAAQIDALSVSVLSLASVSPDAATKMGALIRSLQYDLGGGAGLLFDVQGLADALPVLSAESVRSEMATGRAGAAMEQSANQAKLFGTNVRGMVQEITQTPEQLAAMEQALKDADKAFTEGTKALGTSIATRVSFFDDLDKRAADHNAKLTELQTAYDTESSATRKAAIVVQMQEEMAAYATSDQQAAAHYAEQIAAQQAALGEQLYNWVTAQATMGTIAADKATAIKTAIQTQFGIADTSTAVLFDHMTQSILTWGENGTMTADQFVLSLIKSENAAGDSQRAQEALATQLTGQLTAAYRAGQLSADEYDAALRKIPAEVRTQVNYDINREQMIKDIDAAQKGAYDSGKQVGWSISQGIAAGIASGAVSINPAIVGAVNSAVNAGKKAAGIHSPSTLFADEVGRPISDGIAVGIIKGSGGMQSAIEGALSGMASAGTRMLGGLGGQLAGATGAALDSAIATARQRIATLQSLFDQRFGGDFTLSTDPSRPGVGGSGIRATPSSTGGATSGRVTMPASSQQTANYTYNNANNQAFTYAPTYNSQNPPPPAMDYAQARALAQMGG